MPETTDKTRELSILNTIAKELNRSIDLDQALRTALAEVARLLQLDTSWIFLFDEQTGESYLAASQNLPPALAENPERMEGNCYCLDTYSKGDLKGAANVNVVTCSRLAGLLEGTAGLQYHASIPIYAKEKKLGVLNVGSTEWCELSEEDLQLLNTIADFMSIAIERARLYEQSTEFGAVEERYRLARELHDTLGQGLAAVLLQLDTLDARIDAGADADSLKSSVASAMDLTRSNLEEARRSVLDLRAAPLEGKTLSRALTALAENGSSEHLTVRYESKGGARPLPGHIEAALYRIASEAVTNIARHAEATLASIRLLTTPDEVHLNIEDDGCGFDPDAIPDGHYGLTGLNERVRLLHGDCQIESAPGEGTRLSVIVPIGSPDA
jgi:two-component system NarL family sensor kinase